MHIYLVDILMCHTAGAQDQVRQKMKKCVISHIWNGGARCCDHILIIIRINIIHEIHV